MVGASPALVDLAYEAGRAEDFDQLRSAVLSSICTLVAGDLATVTEVDLVAGRADGRCAPEELPDEVHVMVGRLAHQHPLITHVTGYAETISDYLNPLRFEATELYQDIYRGLGARDQLAITVRTRPGAVIGIAVNRSRPGFGDGDRATLDLLGPILAKGYRRAVARQRGRDLLERLASVAAEPGQPGVLVVGPDGRVEFVSELAERWLRRYFPADRGGGLPQLVTEWLSSDSGATLMVGRRDTQLHLAQLRQEDDGMTVLELREHAARYTTAPLTARQREVLELVATGESNHQISGRLGISRHTVDHHLESIYRKLDVTNRTAAVAAWRKRLQWPESD